MSSLDAYDKTQLGDAMRVAKAKAGETIIKEGEDGNSFYVLEEGQAYACRVLNPGNSKK